MKGIICIVFLISFVFSTHCMAQDIYERVTLDAAIGGEDYIKNWKSGEITDVFISPTEFSVSAKVRLNYYFHKHWGIHGAFSVVTAKTTGNKKDEVPQEIAQRYDADYYILGPRLSTDRTHIYLRAQIGGQYRWENKNWSIIPGISVGFAHISADNCSFVAKGKENNQQYKIEYFSTDNRNIDYGIVAKVFLNPSVQVAYKLKHIHLFAEAGYIQFVNKLTYRAEKTELYDGGQYDKIDYDSKHRANKYEFKLGVTIPISWKLK